MLTTRSQWLTASPLWDDFLSRPDAMEFRQPALLRFNSDHFMDDLQGMLAKAPSSIRGQIAQPETWRAPAVGVASDWISSGRSQAQVAATSASGADTSPPFKLFQPVQGHFYVVAGSLTCRLPGLPDHTVKPAQGERVSLLLRRLAPKDGFTNADCSVYDQTKCVEYAWIGQGPKGVWGSVSNGIVKGEERLPAFQIPFQGKDRTRKLFAGVVPVGRQQSYVTARQQSDATDPTSPPPDDARKIELQRQVIDPWGDLFDWYARNSGFTGLFLSDVQNGVTQGSAFISLDFANFLATYLPNLWAAVQDSSLASSLPTAAKAVYASLQTVDSTGVMTLLQSLRNAKSKEAALEGGQYTPQSSDFASLTDEPFDALINKPDPLTTRLIDVQLQAALDEAGKPVRPAIRVPAMNPQAPLGDNYYILRLAYEQPQCGSKPPVLSDPSRPFQLASYFDPDAPGRSLQVALPIDTSPATLRKYDKNVAFMISKQLADQMKRIKGLKQTMDGDMSTDVGIGMICSFSIPIVTICALIVLMIFVILLNIIFFWLPFLKICFPVPTLEK
jgi:hypothetical protein